MTRAEALEGLRDARRQFCAYERVCFDRGGANQLRAQAYREWLQAVIAFREAE